MKENRRIYYNEQCIFFTENAQELISEKTISNVWVIRKGEKFSLFSIYTSFIESQFDYLIFEGDPEDLFNLFAEHFEIVQAGGGVVLSEENEILMIERMGKWDLPKGKLDMEEDLSSCAVREVEEETGLQNIYLSKFIKFTYHIYYLHGKWILKKTAWFKMKAKKQSLVPQAEEDITKAVWVSRNELNEKLLNSYPNIIYLLEEFKD